MIVVSRAFFFVLLVVLLLSPPARADDARAAAVARKHLQTGVEQYKAGDFEGARLSFQQSFAVRPTGGALRRLAQAELKTGHPLEALEHFRTYATDRNADRDFVANDLPGYIEECHRQLGHVRTMAAPGAVVTVDGRRAVVDDRNQPIKAGETIVVVLPGERLVAIRGEEDQAQRVRVAAGEVVDVTFIKPNEPSPAPSIARPTSPPAPPPREPTPPTTTSSKTLWPPPTVSLIAAGVSGVGIVLGTVFTLIKDGNADDREAFRAQHPGSICGPGGSGTTPACSQWNDLLDTESRNKTLGNVAFGVGIGAAVVSVGTWMLFPRTTTEATRAQVKPILGPGHAGVQIGGNF